MKLINMKVDEFLNEVDKKSATPGGGSVSALVASMGAALLRMTGHLTINKKKFKNYDESIQTAFKESFDALVSIKETLLDLVDQDTAAYDQVMKAFRLPKSNDEEKAARTKAIQDATIVAIESPYSMMETSLEAMKHISIIVEYGNQNTISDIGVATIMLFSAMKGAQMNVLINLDMLKDTELRSDYKTKSSALLKEAKGIHDSVLDTVYKSF